MLSLETSFQCLILIEQGESHPLTGVAGPGMGGGILTAEATLGVVQTSWGMVVPQ